MDICLVSLDYQPYRSSGLSTYAETLSRGLARRGNRVTVLAARRPGLPALEQVAGVKIVRVPIGRSDWIRYSWRAARQLEALENDAPFDIVHFLDVHFAYACRRPFVASLWQSFRQRLTARGGGPCHTGSLDALRRRVYYQVARRLMEVPSLSRAGRLIAGCQSTKNEFIRHYRISADRIDLARQGIDLDRFHPVSAAGLRRRLQLDDHRLLLFVGFITPRKGLEYLGRALQLLPDNVHLLLVGQWSDPRCQPLFRKSLGRAAGRVHEIGPVPDGELPAYYSLADVYVSPSLLEGLGITPVEAQACGTPAVVTSATSGPEEVGDAGLVVPPGDPRALAGAIERLLADDSYREQLGLRGRERVLREFSCLDMVDKTLAAYRRFLDQGSRP